MTQENGGNKTSHTHSPTKYTTRKQHKVRKNTHMHPSKTQETEVQIIQRRNSTTPHCLNSPEKDMFIINILLFQL
jgi:hypothetical protein